MLRVRTDFSGASLGEHAITGSRITARLREEPLVCADGFSHDYGRHFAFGIENLSQEAVSVDAAINCAGTAVLPHEGLLFCGESPSAEFRRATVECRTDRKKAYRIRLPLQPRASVYVANHYFRQHEGLARLFDDLGERGGAAREVIGATVEGRPMVCYRYGSDRDHEPRPTILVTSGMHPPESDTIATEAIMAFLASPDGAKLRDEVNLCVVPLANPDGFVHGHNGCNASGVNFFWQFDAQDERRCPEAYWLWRLIGRVRPVVYVDFHGYTFQLEDRRASPYLKPTILYGNGAVRRLARRLSRRMLELSEGHAMRGGLTYAPSMLASKITQEFNTITLAKYHLHLKDGIERNQERAVSILTAVVAELRGSGLTDPRRILKHPYGRVRRDVACRAGSALVRAWGLRCRPALGTAKRWLLATGS